MHSNLYAYSFVAICVQSKCVFFEFCETEIPFVRLGDVCIALHIQINNINRMEFSRA